VRVDAWLAIDAVFSGANEGAINTINARFRNSIGVVTLMLSSSYRALVASSTGVLPWRAVWLGPRTGAAALCGTTWSVTCQSNRTPKETDWSFRAQADGRRQCLCLGESDSSSLKFL
jgi:hypothetical protein